MIELDSDGYVALQRALCGCFALPVDVASARVICADLPGRAICAATRVDGVLYVVLDLDKPSAPRHAWLMLAEWRDSCHADRRARKKRAIAAAAITVSPVRLALVS